MSVGTPYEPKIANLRVAEAMHEGVLTCDRETSLADVAATMARELVHCVVVGGKDSALLHSLARRTRGRYVLVP